MTMTAGWSMPVVRTENWVTEPIKLTSVRLADDNIEAIAKWVGADGVETTKSFVVGPQEVVFFKLEDPSKLQSRHSFLRARVGDYIMREEENTNQWGEEIETRFYRLDAKDIHKFVPAEMVPPRIAGAQLKSVRIDKDGEVTDIVIETNKGIRHAEVLKGE